ncbi:hypothetical protein C8Q74DRAFT_1271433 [Fomes fomentarius]|nr:hypothetical protein C8Q74DRAFT_1271433 [Fomes fomentarius]
MPSSSDWKQRGTGSRSFLLPVCLLCTLLRPIAGSITAQRAAPHCGVQKMVYPCLRSNLLRASLSLFLPICECNHT